MKKQGAHPPLRLVVEIHDADPIERVFTSPFRMGRDSDCDVMIKNSHVSRNHVELDYKERCWWVHDLESTNGIYVNGKKVNHAPIIDKDILHLGKDGPRIVFNYISAESAAAMPGLDELSGTPRLIPGTQKILMFVIAAVLLGGAGIIFGRHQLSKNDNLAEQAESLFAEIRSADIAIANVYADRAGTDKLLTAQRIINLEKERQAAAEDYKGYLIQMGLYQSLDEKESQIYNTARFFNESEISMPKTFVAEVMNSINQYWLGDGEAPFKEALTRAQLFDYTPFVVKSLEDYGLPAEFFYLPLSISGFEGDKAVNQSEMHNTAGIWQLSVASASAYNLQPAIAGDAFSLGSSDDRFDFRKSTQAATNLLHDIYRNEALASGLLTLAIFLEHEQDTTKGDIQLGSILNSVAKDINERTLWSIRQNHPELISKEVYDQVIRIFAVAVIGQDPRLFDLDVATPTASNYFKAF
ncbi:MAG: FHA domain-containing protein [Rhodothermales bacterium]